MIILFAINASIMKRAKEIVEESMIKVQHPISFILEVNEYECNG